MVSMDDLYRQPKMRQEAPGGGLLTSQYAEENKPKTMDEAYGQVGVPTINPAMHQTVAEASTPEQEALVEKIHQRTFMPKEIIRSDPRTAEAYQQYRDIQHSTADAPATARFLSMAENMAFARDKSAELAKAETNLIGYFWQNFKSTPSQIAAGNVAASYAFDMDNKDDLNKYMLSLTGMEKAEVYKLRSELMADGMSMEDATVEAAKQRQQYHKEYWAGVRDMDAFQIPKEYQQPDTFWEKVAAGAGGSTPGMLLTAVNPAVGTAFFTQQIYGSEFENYIAQGVAPERARDAALASAIMQMPLEYAGNAIQLNRLAKMLKGGSLKTFLTGLIEGSLGEGLEEYLQSYPQYFSEIYATNPNMTAGDALVEFIKKIGTKEFQADALEQGAIGATIGGIMQVPGAVRVQRQNKMVQNILDEQIKQRESQRDTEALRTFRQDVLESDLGNRSKRAAESFVRGIIEKHEGLPDEVYIPGEALAQAMEQNQEETAQLVESLGLTQEEIAQAAANGSDIVVPMVKYAANAFGTKTDAALMNDLRLSPNTYTENQMATVQQEIQAEIKAQIDAIRAQESAEGVFEQERQQVYDDVLKMRQAANVAQKSAVADAEVFAASMAAMSKRYGDGSPLNLYRSLGLQVRGGEMATDDDGVTLAQPAYHGSPYKFDKFTTDHIGTGEGAQAYGWGLYFAGQRGVAEFYKNNLSKVKILIDGKSVGTYSSKDANFEQKIIKKLNGFKDKRGAAAAINYLIKNGFDFDNAADEIAGLSVYFAEKYGLALEELRGRVDSVVGGQLYEVDIPENDTLLLYDKPLTGQNKNVKQILKDSGVWKEFRENKSDYSARMDTRVDRGEGIYAFLRDKYGSDRAASEYLNSIGIKGIKYLDGTSRGKGRGSYNYVIFDDSTIEILKTYYQAAETEKNASVSMNLTDAKTIVNLFNSANESSFLHEGGHIFFELLGFMAQQPNANEAAKADWQVVLDYVGNDGTEQLTTEQHEKLARTLEAYFMDGKAPSLKLRKVFQKFADWLKSIYRDLAGLSEAAKKDIKPTPEITALMDRMFATDEEIKVAQDYYGKRDAYHEEAANISEEEHQKYLEALQDAEDEAKDSRLRRYMAAWSKVVGDRKTREARIREQVEAEPVYAAMDTIRKEDNGRLDISALDSMVGEETRKKLSKKGLTKNEGSDPEIMAARHGFASVDEMVGAMLEAETKTDRVKRLADEEQAKKAEEIARAVEAKGQPHSAQDVHNDAALSALFMELEMLRKKRQPKGAEPALRSITATAKRNAVRDSARRQLEDMPVSKARRYDTFSRAEAQAAKEAAAATKAGDYALAEQAKLRQIMNHALVLEAVKIREEVAKAENMVKRVKNQKSLLAESRDLIMDIATRFGFNSVPRSQVAQAFAQYRAEMERAEQPVQSLSMWADDMEEQGLTIFAPEWIDASPSRPHQELTLEQWRDVTDTIRSIQIADRMQRIVLNDEKKRTREQLLADLTASLEENAKKKRKPSRDTGRIRANVSATHAWHMKLETVLIDLDGGSPGLLWETFYLPFENAANEEFLRLREAEAKVNELFGQFSTADRIRMSTKKEYIPAISASLTRWQIIMSALNSGNEGNLERLKRGEGWNESQHAAVIDMLTKEEMDFVQGVWDYIDTFREESFALDKELAGRTPRRVEPRPLQTKHGVYRGGYLPIKTDPKLGYKAAIQQSLDSITKGGSLKGTHHASAATRRGHLKERNRGTGEPLKLDPEVITEHIFQVIHDLTHRKAVQGVAQLANDSNIMALLQDYAGLEMVKQIMPWIQDIAAEQNGPQSPIHKAARWARTGTTLMSMGFKATTGVTQFVGYTGTIDQLKGWDKKWAAVGLATVYRNPANLPKLLQQTFEKSPFMQGRLKSFDRDIRDSAKRLSGKDLVRGKINEFAFMHIGIAQMGVDLPTWWSMYAKTMAETGDETKAIRNADSFVRQTQGSGATKDLARIQRGDDLMRIFTMFYSYFNTLYNMAYLSGKYIGKKWMVGGVAAAAGSAMWLWILPALLSEYVAGRGPDEDEEALEWAIPIVGLYPTQAVVGLRDAANALGTQFDYAATPAQAPVESIDRWVGAIKKAWDEEDATLLIEPSIQAGGYLLHLPLGQPLITGGNIVDYATGQDPDFYLRDLLFRKPKDRR